MRNSFDDIRFFLINDRFLIIENHRSVNENEYSRQRSISYFITLSIFQSFLITF